MRADAKANRQDLIDTAWRLLALHGPDISLRSVAAEAGVGIGTLYRHFPTREELLLGVGGEIRDRVVALSDQYRPLMESDPQAAWPAYVRELAGIGLGALVSAIAQDASMLESMFERSAELRGQALAAVTGVLAAAHRAGLVDPDVDANHFYLGLGALTRPIPAVARAIVPDETSWLVEIYLRGLRPTASPSGTVSGGVDG